jgi:hypothetical protein
VVIVGTKPTLRQYRLSTSIASISETFSGPEARRALQHVEDVQIPVDIDDPRLEVLAPDT